MTDAPATLAALRAALRRDRDRLRAHHARYGMAAPTWLLASPSYQCILLHRVAHYFYRNRRRLLARLVWHCNLLLTGGEISPHCPIGGGFVLVHPMTVAIYGRIGEDCTIWGFSGVGGGRDETDIGGGPGLPVLGDRVELSWRAVVLGPVRIGADTLIGPGAVVSHDIPAGSRVEVAGPLVTFRPASGGSPSAGGA